MNYTALKKHEEFTENPFVTRALKNDLNNAPGHIGFISKTKKNVFVGNTKDIIVNQETGERTGHTAFLKMIEVDEEKFAKIYIANIKQLYELSNNAIKVFGYILTILPPNKDKVTFKLEECKTHTGYSAKTTIMSALGQLIENGFIARTKFSYEYFINPLLFFNGNRITFMQQYIIQKKKKISSTKEQDISLFDFPKPMEYTNEQHTSETD